MFPKIDSPCPIRWKALPQAGRDFCTLCQRRVHNLDAMNAAERSAFLAACDGPVCVAYTAPRPRSAVPLAAGLGLAAALSLTPALAAEPAPAMSPAPQQSLLPAEPKADCDTAPAADEALESIVLTGAVVRPNAAAWGSTVHWPDYAPAPELPLINRDAFLNGEAEFTTAPESATPR
jgi:hypothetical protein